MTIDVELAGCRPQPLASYLKALGVLRLVAEQADASVLGYWSRGIFHLRTVLDQPALVEFFTARYAPTPLVAPWNGGSGFGAKDVTSSPTAVAAVEAISVSSTERLHAYRRTVTAARFITSRHGWVDLTKEEQERSVGTSCQMRRWLGSMRPWC